MTIYSLTGPTGSARDWADIRELLHAAAHQRRVLDWDLMADYLAIFEMSDELDTLRAWYGEAE